MDRERLRSRTENLWERSKDNGENSYWLTRFLFLQVLGFTYFFAFLSLVLQLKPLLGSKGLTPVHSYLPEEVSFSLFMKLPTVFWLNQSDFFMMVLGIIGLIISALLLFGFANVPLLMTNWFIYLSFVNVGQVWYGYGWETQLLETGLLAVFLVPLLDPRPFSSKVPPPKPLIWMLRWLSVRVYLGSGLIKMKGVGCWHDLTCLSRFFQTQPIPNPISPWMHQLPIAFHKIGALYTHLVQLIVPYSAIFENRYRKLRIYGGLLMLSLQIGLIMTGNFAFLNWVTVAAVISFLDDRFLSLVLPEFVVERAEKAKERSSGVSNKRHAINLILVVLVVIASIPVVVNLISPAQNMNASFNNWKFVNTYGAFGSVRDYRTELVVEGTRARDLSEAEWKEYDFRFKPDQEDDPLPVVAPYQPRFSWQMWFASMSSPEREPWLLHMTWKLLHNDPQALKFVKENPFKKKPPRYIRIKSYRFEMEPPLSENNWERYYQKTWMEPVSRNNTQLEMFLDTKYGR